MGDAANGQFIKRFMQIDRPRRRQGAIMRAGRIDDANRTQRRSGMTTGPPDLAQKGDNRGFAAGAGDGDNRLRLTRIESRRRMRKRGAHIINVMTRLMGLILAALAVEVMAGGLVKIFPILASPAITP